MCGPMRTRAFVAPFLWLLVLVSTSAQKLLAQNITVNSSFPYNQPMYLIDSILVGPNLSVFSPIGPLGIPITQPNSVQIGKFVSGNPLFGLDSGIVMVTTNANDVVIGQSGNYQSVGMTNTPELTGLLNQLNASNTEQYDLAKIEFSFIAPGDSVKFDYIFASREYAGYTCSAFTDVFGFFIIGQGINGAPMNNSNGTARFDTVNIALIPGTSTPVAINTINQGFGSNPSNNYICLAANPNFVANSIMYNPNTGTTGLNSGYGGYTDVFTAKAQVKCGHLYTIKLLICDVSDHLLNSAVFLGAKSFELPTITLSQSFNQNNSINDSLAVEGCQPSWLY